MSPQRRHDGGRVTIEWCGVFAVRHGGEGEQAKCRRAYGEGGKECCARVEVALRPPQDQIQAACRHLQTTQCRCEALPAAARVALLPREFGSQLTRRVSFEGVSA